MSLSLAYIAKTKIAAERDIFVKPGLCSRLDRRLEFGLDCGLNFLKSFCAQITQSGNLLSSEVR